MILSEIELVVEKSKDKEHLIKSTDALINLSVPNAFNCCPNPRPSKCDSILQQRTFVSDKKWMIQNRLENSTFDKFTSMKFSENVLSKGKIGPII